ncbi:MAG: hypothetical protein HXY34_05830 [Candidatus Thorarchaeota archaeon]|nr:hypothetical protein [Candidatus Thorarchaeota archaeon]
MFPECLGALIELEELDISKNQFEQLSESLLSLTHLRILDISSNPLPSLPDWIQVLQSRGCQVTTSFWERR